MLRATGKSQSRPLRTDLSGMAVLFQVPSSSSVATQPLTNVPSSATMLPLVQYHTQESMCIAKTITNARPSPGLWLPQHLAYRHAASPTGNLVAPDLQVAAEHNRLAESRDHTLDACHAQHLGEPNQPQRL